jgi:hypothetical protein
MNGAPTPHFGICIRNDGCEDLQLRKLYQLLPDETAERNGLLRVIDDSGEDYLYPTANFIAVSLPASVERTLADLPIAASSR